MNNEINELDELLNTLKTSSLEPHEEYTMQFSNREQKILLDYIINLQENYEKIYNENCKLRKQHNINDISLLDENHNLQEENEMLSKECDTYMKISTKKQQRIDKAIEYIKNNWYELNTRDIEHCINLNKDIRIDLLNILNGDNINE